MTHAFRRRPWRRKNYRVGVTVLAGPGIGSSLSKAGLNPGRHRFFEVLERLNRSIAGCITPGQFRDLAHVPIVWVAHDHAVVRKSQSALHFGFAFLISHLLAPQIANFYGQCQRASLADMPTAVFALL